MVERNENGALTDLAWSPCSAYLAYVSADAPKTQSVKLVDVSDPRPVAVSGRGFKDFAPSFDPGGKYLYFLSYRSFDPVYDSVFFDLGFPLASRPYAVVLSSATPSPFVAKAKSPGAEPAEDKASGGHGSEEGPRPAALGRAGPGGTAEPAVEGEPARLDVDFDGIEGRVLAFPVPEGRYSQIAGIRGKALFTVSPVQGSLDKHSLDVEPKETGSLEVYDFEEQRHETLLGNVSSFSVSLDSSTLVYWTGERLRAFAAAKEPPEAGDQDPPGRKAGWLDLERVRVSVDPAAEWRQMLTEAWRLQRDHFWVEDLSGVDWQRVLERYLPLVDRVSTRSEFSDLMWEMQGELGTSHAYELGGDYRQAPPYTLGHLGADIDFDAASDRWKVAHLVAGDSFDEAEASPLAAPGLGIVPGTEILAVGGQRVDESTSPASLLVHQAGQAVELVVASPASAAQAGDDAASGSAAALRDQPGSPRRVVVAAVADERPGRYREWVTTKRAKVHEATSGRVGYLHVPDMGPRGFAEFHRYYLSEIEHEALVVDVRYNGGGHVSPLLLEKLARRRIGYDVSRWAPPEPYPTESPHGPLVLVTDENAGSDGDIFTHGFKLLHLGPVVGKRTWGGVVGIDPTHALVDGSLTTQPEYAFWFVDVGFALENRGSEPDYEVEITPEDYAAGRDPQLDRAVSLALEALGRPRAAQPDLKQRAMLELPVLPSRRGKGPLSCR